jgi:hypothetical protein
VMGDVNKGWENVRGCYFYWEDLNSKIFVFDRLESTATVKRRAHHGVFEHPPSEAGSKVESAERMEERQRPSDKYISASFERLTEVKAKSIDLVTEARVRAETREHKRRNDVNEDDEKRNILLHLVNQQDGEDEVISGFDECLAATDLDALSELLVKQEKLCEASIAKLEHITKELGSELRQKDHEFVTALKRSQHDVEELQQCITNEHLLLKSAFENELKMIEKSLVTNRDETIKTHKDELETLISRRNEEESKNLDRQRKIIEGHKSEIRNCEVEGVRDREELREKLEGEVRRLEIELEKTKTGQQLDADKLDFNVDVLTKLSESEESIKKQKRRIQKGKEGLTTKLEERQQAKTKGIRLNDQLEADCERIEKQSSGLSDKFERFKLSDDEKYRAVRDMHGEDLLKLQSELKQSQDFIFGGVIGCADGNDKAEQQSCASGVTSPSNAGSSVKTRDSTDEFGLECDGRSKDEYSDSFDKCVEWGQAETLMSNYKAILERREDLHAEVMSMGHQNTHLERELESKLKDKINEQLAFPPRDLIALGAGKDSA